MGTFVNVIRVTKETDATRPVLPSSWWCSCSNWSNVSWGTVHQVCCDHQANGSSSYSYHRQNSAENFQNLYCYIQEKIHLIEFPGPIMLKQCEQFVKEKNHSITWIFLWVEELHLSVHRGQSHSTNDLNEGKFWEIQFKWSRCSTQLPS